jgi:WD40 repeat protein
VAGTYDNELLSWDSETGEPAPKVELGSASSEVTDVAFSGDGQLIVVATGTATTGRLHVLRASDLSLVGDWPASDVSLIDVSDDGRYVATSGNQRHVVQVWDTEHPDAPLQQLRQATGTLGHVTLSQDADASRVAVTTSEGKVYVWDRATGQLLSVMQRHADFANQVAFDPVDLERLVSAGDDGEMLTYLCDFCTMDVDELQAAAKSRRAQHISASE